MEFENNILMFNGFATVTIAVVVLFVGNKILASSTLLRNLTIPEPVVGGLLFSLIFAFIHLISEVKINFDMEARDVLLLYFFTTIGINANMKDMKKGGKPLVLLLVIAVIYMILQNVVGIVTAMQINPENYAIGIIGSSVSLIGGHGTAIAWAPIIEQELGLDSAMELGLASATFGIILASIIGGPIAKYLIKKHSLSATKETHRRPMAIGIENDRKAEELISFYGFLKSLLAIHLSIILGYLLYNIITSFGINIPFFVMCLLSGILLTNTIPRVVKSIPWPNNNNYSTSLIAEVTLGLFLAMSLMNMQIWNLVDLAGPLVSILFVQVVVAILYIIYIVFPLMGKNYDAAVISAGFGGISLGATPTAIMNMTAVTEKFGPSRLSFIILPLVSAFFIDIFNVVSVQTVITILK